MSKTSKGAIKETSKFAKVFIYLMLAFLAIIIIVPVAWVFMASIKENSEFYRSPWALPEGFYFRLPMYWPDLSSARPSSGM